MCPSFNCFILINSSINYTGRWLLSHKGRGVERKHKEAREPGETKKRNEPTAQDKPWEAGYLGSKSTKWFCPIKLQKEKILGLRQKNLFIITSINASGSPHRISSPWIVFINIICPSNKSALIVKCWAITTQKVFGTEQYAFTLSSSGTPERLLISSGLLLKTVKKLQGQEIRGCSGRCWGSWALRACQSLVEHSVVDHEVIMLLWINRSCAGLLLNYSIGKAGLV